MKNLQVGPETATDILLELVPECSYKPEWNLEIKELDRGQGCEGLTLCISAKVKDAFSDKIIQIYHLMPVPPAAYDRETWQQWIMEQIFLVEKHEAMEFFRVNGEQPFFPGHAPGRDPYALALIKTKEQAHIPAVPWNGGPARDPHFTNG